MGKSKNVRLTRKTAVYLIRSAVPVSPKAIEGGDQGTGATIYTVYTGALEITCSNDWYTSNGRIQLIIADRLGGSSICMYFHPDTLNRDFGMEDAEKRGTKREDRVNWVAEVGKEQAHKLVDQYWGG